MKEEIIKALTIIEEEEGRVKRDIEIIHKAKEEIEKLREEKESWRRLATKYMNNNQDAIEYLKEKAIYDVNIKEFCRDLYYYNCLELLNILEGENNEEK